MVHLKIVLDTRRKKSDNTYPIVLRVTNFKKVHLIPSGHSIYDVDWDAGKLFVKNSHPNSSSINLSLSKRYYQVQKAILKLEDESNFSFESLKSELNPLRLQTDTKQPLLFKDYSETLVAEMMEANRTGNALIYQTAINRVVGFSDNTRLTIENIDYTFLNSFKHQLIKDGVKTNTIGNYFRSIRAIYNKAIKAKLVERSIYPFTDIVIKTEKTAKRALRMIDLIKIYKSNYEEGTPKWHARNFFLLSFSLRGMSFTDLAYLKIDNIKGGRLVYRRKKTGSGLDVKLTNLSLSLFDIYKQNDCNYLLPVFSNVSFENGKNAISATRQWIKTTNKWLNRIATDCNIDSEITTYVTRHSWATAAKRLGYSNELIAECLGHQYGNKITNIYLDDFDQSLIDEVNEKVINAII